MRNLVIQEFDKLKNSDEKYKNLKPEEKWNHLENDFVFEEDFIGRWVESTNATQQKYSAYNDLQEIYSSKYKDSLAKKKIELFYSDFERDLRYFSMLYDDSISSSVIKGKINFLLNAPNLRYTLNLLVAAFRHFNYDGKENKDLQNLITSYESYQLYLQFSASSTRFSSGPIYELIKKLNEGHKTVEIRDFIYDKKISHDSLLADFKIAFSKGIKDNYLAKLLLSKYVWHIESQTADDVVQQRLDFDKATLEHICPQKIPKGSKWERDFLKDQEKNDIIYLLGNMTLLTQRLNSSAKNLEWAEKVNRYKKTKLLITQELVNIENITPAFIYKRHENIVEGILTDLKKV